MLPSLVRRAALLAPLGLLAALLPLALPAAPAQAIAGCLQENGALGGCDDTTPPVFTPDDVTVSAASGTATVTAHATYSDADVDPISYQCALDSSSFGSCGPFPAVAAGNHTLKVRAIDSHDQPVVACQVVCAPVYTETAPDYTEVQKQFSVSPDGTSAPPGPGGAPETQITGGPTDKLTPGQPVALTRHPTIVLTASEPATFNCAVNARKVPCQGGVTVLKKLKPGPQVFVAQAVDADGNFDATPASLTFYVPYNLEPGQGHGWRRVKGHGAYAGDYLMTSKRGATLTLGRLRDVHEIRLIAPAGPKLGRVAVRVGRGPWIQVKLTSSKSSKLRVLELRAADTKAVSGALQIKALKIPPGGAVAVDAVVAR